MSNDFYRFGDLRKIIMFYTYRSLIALGMGLANPESSDKGFTVGNRETLNVTDIYEQVIDFHARYYSANLMTLAIVANDTLDRYY